MRLITNFSTKLLLPLRSNKFARK